MIITLKERDMIGVYVITDAEAIGYLQNDDLDGFKQMLSENEYLDFSEPVSFNTEEEALAFCAALGYGVDDYSTPVEKYPLRSFEDADKPFIELIRSY